ncbi:MAG: lysylphosphatidylglycerol synthase transmembrane domain-containing protein [Anaerolineales bacterium]|jgi:uncharacterized protein (TIRG00374 family)
MSQTQPNHRTRLVRNLFFAFILLLTILFVSSHFDEVQRIIDKLRQGDWRWLALAALVQIVWLINISGKFTVIYRLMGLRESIAHLAPLAAAANFFNVIAPSFGMGGVAVFAVDGRRRNLPAGKITTSAALYVLYDYIGLLVTLALVLFVLFTHNQLDREVVISSIVLAGISVGLGVLLFLGMRSRDQLGRALAWLSRLVNRILRPFIRRDYLEESRAYGFANDVAEGLLQARRSRGGLILPIVLALTGKTLLVCILAIVFISYGQPFTIGTLIVGIGVASLVLIFSITPSGVIFVEGAMAFFLERMGVPATEAWAITLAYRGITFWWPLSYGLIAFRWFSKGSKRQPELEPAESQPESMPISALPATSQGLDQTPED